MKFQFLLQCLILVSWSWQHRADADIQLYPVTNLYENGDTKTIERPKDSYDKLEIFCHKGKEICLSRFWSSSVLRVRIASDDFRLFLGPNSTTVSNDYDQSRNVWFQVSSGNFLALKSKDVRLNPFSETCVGVVANEEYSVTLQIYRVNYWQVVMTLAGLLLFFNAPRLCRNIFFHYATGVATGVAFSLLVITYFVQKKFRAGWFGWIMGFYSVSLYFLTSFWYNMRDYLVDNHVYVLAYLLLSGGISFAICYRMGPVENPRTMDLIQWTLQLVALLLIYLSSYHQVASLALALAILGWVSIPDRTKSKAQTWYKVSFFKPKIRLLSEDEYMDQSRVETERALAQLRSFCKSPKCDSWKFASRLQSPTRFAEFVEGSPHLTQNEVMNYSNFSDELDVEEFTDDEDDNNAIVTNSRNHHGGDGRTQAQMMTDDEESE